jgi:hypothetical protein
LDNAFLKDAMQKIAQIGGQSINRKRQGIQSNGPGLPNPLYHLHLCKLAILDGDENTALKHFLSVDISMPYQTTHRLENLNDSMTSMPLKEKFSAFLNYLFLLAMVQGMENFCILMAESGFFLTFETSILHESILLPEMYIKKQDSQPQSEQALQSIADFKPVDLNAIFPSYLHIATSLGLENLILYMITKGGADPNFPWHTLLSIHIACAWNNIGHVPLCKILLAYGIPSDTTISAEILKAFFILRNIYTREILQQEILYPGNFSGMLSKISLLDEIDLYSLASSVDNPSILKLLSSGQMSASALLLNTPRTPSKGAFLARKRSCSVSNASLLLQETSDNSSDLSVSLNFVKARTIDITNNIEDTFHSASAISSSPLIGSVKIVDEPSGSQSDSEKTVAQKGKKIPILSKRSSLSWLFSRKNPHK